MEVTQKDIDDTLRAAGVKPIKDAPAGAAVLNDDHAETLRQAGVPLSALSAPVLKQQMPPEAESKPGPTIEREAQRISRAMPVETPIAEGMPVIGNLPRMATAGISAAVPGMGLPGETFGERYSQNDAALSRASKLYGERHPVWSPVGNLIGGALATAPVAASPLGGLVLGTRGPSVPSRLLQGMAGGSTIGATDAALRGENVPDAAMIGAGAGALGPVVSEGMRGLVNSGANRIWSPGGVLSKVQPANINRLASVIEGETPASMREGRDRAGPAGMLMDLNTGMTDLAGGLADTPGPQKAIVREALRLRSKGQGDRIEQALTKEIAPRTNIEQFKDFLTETRKAAADPLYEQWRTTQIHPTDKLKELLPRLEKAGAFDMAEELSGISGEPITKAFFTGGPQKRFPTAQSWDYVKRGLDRSIDQAYSKGDKTLARALVQLRNETVSEIEKAPGGQVWKQARGEWAERSELLDQVERGHDTLLGGRTGISADELKAELKGINGPALDARLQGLRAAADEAMGATTRGDTTLRNKILAPNNRAKIEVTLAARYGDAVGKARADRLIKTMEQEAFLKEQDQNIRGGSQTTPKKERVDALKPSPTPHWDPNIAQPSTWLPPKWMEGFRPANLVDAWKGQRSAAANNQLGDLITTREGPQMDDLIKAIHEEALRRAIRDVRATHTGNAVFNLVQPAGTSYRRQRAAQP